MGPMKAIAKLLKREQKCAPATSQWHFQGQHVSISKTVTICSQEFVRRKASPGSHAMLGCAVPNSRFLQGCALTSGSLHSVAESADAIAPPLINDLGFPPMAA